MNIDRFVSTTDVELNDVVRFKTDGLLYQIHDIRLIHYHVSKSVEFEFQLDRGGRIIGWLKRDDFIYPVE